MGSYNSQYQNYYNSLLNGKLVRKSSYSNKNFIGGKSLNITKRIIQELLGVFILTAFVVSYKIIMPYYPKAAQGYDYSKKIVSVDYDYSSAYNQIKSININNINLKNLQDDALKFIESLRVKMNEVKFYSNRIKDKDN